MLVDDSEASRGMPVLIDFGSAREVGSLLGTSRGTSGWIQGRIEDYTTSKKEHDVFARRKCGSGWTTRLSTMIKAEEFELDIYTLQLSGISDSQLIKLLAELPPKCIVLAEEVEAANYNGEPT